MSENRQIARAPYPTPDLDYLTTRGVVEQMVASLNPHDGHDYQIAAMLRALLAENDRLRTLLNRRLNHAYQSEAQWLEEVRTALKDARHG